MLLGPYAEKAISWFTAGPVPLLASAYRDTVSLSLYAWLGTFIPLPLWSVYKSMDGPGGGVICFDRMYVAPVRRLTARMASKAAFSRSFPKSANFIPFAFPLWYSSSIEYLMLHFYTRV